jgi:hypothetical protein
VSQAPVLVSVLRSTGAPWIYTKNGRKTHDFVADDRRRLPSMTYLRKLRYEASAAILSSDNVVAMCGIGGPVAAL